MNISMNNKKFDDIKELAKILPLLHKDQIRYLLDMARMGLAGYQSGKEEQK